MKTQLSGLIKASVLTACLFTVLPNAFAESSEYPGLAQENDVRVELLTALELQLSVVESLGRDDLVARLNKSIDEVQFASEAELAPVEGAIDEFRNHAAVLQQLELAIQDDSVGGAPSPKMPRITTEAKYSNTTNAAISPLSLSGPEYYTGGSCGGDIGTGGRNDTQAILTASIAVGVAKVAWAAVEVACGLDIVALASGGLGTVACAAAAALVATAEEVLEGFNRCDATVDEAHLDAAFDRAEDNFELGTHIHSDLTSHDQSIASDLATHDTDVNNNIDQHHTDITSQLTAHDTNIDGDLAAHNLNIDSDLIAHDANLVAHDTNIDSDLIAHDANIDGDLIVHDTTIKALLDNIQGSVNENQRLIKISMARQAEILRLLITPSGKREINPDVLSCTGADCPQADIVLSCKNGLDWPCK